MPREKLIACALFLRLLTHVITQCESFSLSSPTTTRSRKASAFHRVDPRNNNSRGGRVCAVPFFADNTKSEADETQSDVIIVPSEGDTPSIKEAACFMVEAFWLQSPQQLRTDDTEADVSDVAKLSLIEHQEEDLINKYGERLGKRPLESCLLTAVSDDGMLGLVGIEARLLNKKAREILTAERSEFMLKNAVASLGPKQRRQYKDSPASELVTELLPPEYVLVCCLSNLAVSPKARRRGVGIKLCKDAEKMAKDLWNFDAMHLKVEQENKAARGLYEDKLGYIERFSDASAVGLRVDVKAGSFVEQQAETLVLSKSL